MKLLKSELITKKSFRLDQAHTHAPFTSSSARFKSKKVQARMAHLGPATYDVNSQSIAVQSIRDAILKKTMKGKIFLFRTDHSLPNNLLFVQITLQHVLSMQMWDSAVHSFYSISEGRVAITCLNMVTSVQLYGVQNTVYQIPHLSLFEKRHFKADLEQIRRDQMEH